MTTEHKTRTFKPADTRDGRYGFTCDSCAGRWVYYSASEAEAHAAAHERTGI